MNTSINASDLLDSLQSVRKFRNNDTSSNTRKKLDELDKRISYIEKFLKNIPKQEEPQVPEGFMPIQHYFKLKPEVSETQIRKWLDDAVTSGSVEVGRWRNEKTKKVCKWYRAKVSSPLLV